MAEYSNKKGKNKNLKNKSRLKWKGQRNASDVYIKKDILILARSETVIRTLRHLTKDSNQVSDYKLE